MGTVLNQQSLKKFAKAFEALALDKRIAAAKWVEGVIVAQPLSEEERGVIVKAANEYISNVDEGEYVDAVNALTGYLDKVQKRARRELKKRKTDGVVELAADHGAQEEEVEGRGEVCPS